MPTCVPGQTPMRPCSASATRLSNLFMPSSRYLSMNSPFTLSYRSSKSHTETRLLLRAHPHPHFQRLRRRRGNLSRNILVCVPTPRTIVTGVRITRAACRVLLETSLLDGVLPTPPRSSRIVTCPRVHAFSLFPCRAIPDKPTPCRVLDA